jgi:hypothetical protein
MNRALILSAAMLFATASAEADEPVINEAIRKYADAVEEASSQLGTVHDQGSANKATETLVRLDKEAGEWRARWKQAQTREPPGGAILRHANGITDEFEVAWSRVVDAEVANGLLEKLPEFRKVIAERAASRKPGLFDLLGERENAKHNLAKIKANAVASAAQRYLVKTGNLPASLQDLLTPPGGGLPYVEADFLTDPWGLPFQYDPNGPHNKGLKPDVWSIGPDASDPKGRLGNWRSAPQMKTDK